jgi:hypothetical protein
MPRCRACGRYQRGEAEKIGARCHSCAEPLYESPFASAGGGRAQDDTVCAVHPANGALGTCTRCGNFFCAVCRTSWHGNLICPICLDRALETHEAVPAHQRAQWLHSLFALILGGSAWVITVLGFVVVAIGVSNGVNVGAVGVGTMMLCGAVIPAALGAGLGASAIRARGSHMILATVGLVLGALHVGMLIGLFSFVLRQRFEG